jgi:imidazole glycerol-phosphate synthase subunit HisH
MQTVALIDAGSGNLRSAEKALLKAAHNANRRREVRVTADPEFIRRADRIVLPGVGAFAACMAGLEETEGLREAMVENVRERAVAFLGICVGMQQMADYGLEFGSTPGLGWIPGHVSVLEPADTGLKIPHMGWNEVVPRPHPVFDKAWQGKARDVYFVHSFSFKPSDPADIVGDVDYGGRVVAAVARDNLVGVQFHPEKSQAAGLDLLAAWLDWNP